MEKDKEEEGVPESVNNHANVQRPERDSTFKELRVGWKRWSIVVCEDEAGTTGQGEITESWA